MTAGYLWPSPNTPANTFVNNATYYHWQKFHVTSGPKSIVGARWYRASTSGPSPSLLVFADGVTGAYIQTIYLADSGSVGWQQSNISPLQLTTGRIYALGTTEATGCVVSWSNPGPTPDSPLVRDGSLYGTGPLPASVTGTASTDAIFLDVVIDDALSSDPLATLLSTDVDASIERWLSDSTEANTHQSDGLPWRTDANVTTIKDAATGANGFDAIKAVADAIASAVGGLPGTIASAVTTMTGQLASAVTTIQGTSARTVTEVYDKTVDALTHLADLAAGTGGGATGALSGRSGFPTVLWTLAGETDWTGELAWDVGADLYVLSITDPNGHPPTVVAGADWYPRLGWWAIKTDTLIGERRFFEFGANRLEDEGRRMPGVLLKANDGFVSGHIQAWVLT